MSATAVAEVVRPAARGLRPTPELHRTTFQVSRKIEYFSEKELVLQIGHHKEGWNLALTKELIDNGLDAAEQAVHAADWADTVDDVYDFDAWEIEPVEAEAKIEFKAERAP